MYFQMDLLFHIQYIDTVIEYLYLFYRYLEIMGIQLDIVNNLY